MENIQVGLKKYIITFAIVYTALHLLIMGGMYVFDIDNGNSMNIPMLIIAVLCTSNTFIKDNNRGFEKSEIRKLSFFSMLVSFLASIFVYVLVINFDPSLSVSDIKELLASLPAIVWLLIILFIGMFYYFILTLCYGWLTNKVYAKQFIKKI
jgi:hypothetical protein